MKNHEGLIHTKNSHFNILNTHTVRLTCDNRHLNAGLPLWEHDITELMVWMCVQRDVVQDKFMLTSSQAVKWPSAKRADCKAILFTASLPGPWLISPVKTIIQRIPLKGFAGKRNHEHRPVWMYKQLDQRLESVFVKLVLTLTDDVQGFLFLVWEFGMLLGPSLSSRWVHVPEVQAGGCSDGGRQE